MNRMRKMSFIMEEQYDEKLENRLISQYVDANRIRLTDKSDKSTHDKVLNFSVQKTLLRFINKKIIREIHGCVSTGKEANVYYGLMKNNTEIAIKIFKVDILDYKNRQRYMEGEYRFKTWKYSKNPRKMVRRWAEKEFRNLKRLSANGIQSPEPFYLTDNIIIMKFLGNNGIALPKLKCATISNPEKTFNDCVNLMRKMYQGAKLVHADFSEYNLLYNSESDELFIIDVSQAVDRDSPRAFDFLRKDIDTISNFFLNFRINVPPVRNLFNYIIKSQIDNENEALASVLSTLTLEDEAVFKNAFIPRNLSEVPHPERDLDKVRSGECAELFYLVPTRMDSFQECLKSADQSEGEDKISIILENEQPSSQTDCKSSKLSYSKEDIKGKRKENKKAVKSENKLKRLTKMPKHIKKMNEKKSKKKS